MIKARHPCRSLQGMRLLHLHKNSGIVCCILQAMRMRFLANSKSSSSFSANHILSNNVCLPLPASQDPTYESMDNRATNLKKRKFDCSSSSTPLLGQPSFSVPINDLSSSLAIPGESSTLPSW